MSIKINSVKIDGNISTRFGCALTYTFEFTAKNRSGFALEFSLPDNSVVSGFSAEFGGVSVAGKVSDLETAANNNFRVFQRADGRCRIECAGIPNNSKEFTLKVNSVTLMSLNSEYAEITIPLETECDKFVRSESERRSTVCTDSNVTIDVKVMGGFAGRISSSSHYAEISGSGNILNVHTETVTHNSFTLRLEYKSLQDSRRFENTLYMTGGYDCDFTGVYLFTAGNDEAGKRPEKDLIYVFDPGRSVSYTSGWIAAECLQELIHRQYTYNKCLIVSSDGQLFKSEPLDKNEIDFRELRKWFISLENIDTPENTNSEKIISSFKNQILPCEAVLVTCTGQACDLTLLDDLCVNVLSVSENPFERGLKELAEKSGGVYARMGKTQDYTQFIDGFSERVSSGRLNNLKILEYAPGTYFNVPNEIKNYRMGDVIAYTFRSATDYPRQLFIEADGGYSEVIKFDSINILSCSDENNAVFAQKVFSELYRYIARGDIAPDSVTGFKAQAEKLSHELNVLCPETAYSAGFLDSVYSIEDKSYSSDVVLRLGGSKPLDKHAEFVPAFSDNVMITSMIRNKLIYYSICALLVFMRTDYRFTSPYRNQSSDLETMYAAAAIYSAADGGYVPDKAAYISIADKAVTAAGGKERFDNTAIDFGGTEPLSLYDAKMVLDKNNVIEISRLILRLCRDRNMC